jgi:hypothetical protein
LVWLISARLCSLRRAAAQSRGAYPRGNETLGQRFESARRLFTLDYFAAAFQGGKPIAYILQEGPSTAVNKDKKYSSEVQDAILVMVARR